MAASCLLVRLAGPPKAWGACGLLHLEGTERCVLLSAMLHVTMQSRSAGEVVAEGLWEAACMPVSSEQETCGLSVMYTRPTAQCT